MSSLMDKAFSAPEMALSHLKSLYPPALTLPVLRYHHPWKDNFCYRDCVAGLIFLSLFIVAGLATANGRRTNLRQDSLEIAFKECWCWHSKDDNDKGLLSNNTDADLLKMIMIKDNDKLQCVPRGPRVFLLMFIVRLERGNQSYLMIGTSGWWWAWFRIIYQHINIWYIYDMWSQHINISCHMLSSYVTLSYSYFCHTLHYGEVEKQ